MPRLVRTPDINELRSLCVAADSGTLGRAAMRLGISQPALTKRLQVLEQLAGQPLLERSPRGVSLTPAGRRIYEEAGSLLENATRIEELLAGMRRQSAPLRLAASHSSCEAFVTDVLAAVSEERGGRRSEGASWRPCDHSFALGLACSDHRQTSPIRGRMEPKSDAA